MALTDTIIYTEEVNLWSEHSGRLNPWDFRWRWFWAQEQEGTKGGKAWHDPQWSWGYQGDPGWNNT